MILDYCFHTHTSRCGHAKGEDESYVKEAIKANVKVMGFSDHNFLPDYPQPGTRGNIEELDDYISSVESLREKYNDKINILLGFECEYFPRYKKYFRYLKEEKGFDYLILGQHFYRKNKELYYVRDYCFKSTRRKYVSLVKKGLKSGLFLYLAHPDLVFNTKEHWDDECIKISHKLCKLAERYHIPVELNINGFRWPIKGKVNYPTDEFWEIASHYKLDVVIGYDAHYPEFFSEEQYKLQVEEIAKKYNLHLLTKEDLLARINK